MQAGWDAQGYTVAIRLMLRDDGSAAMTLFFGFVGALNAACLAPLLLGLQLAQRVDIMHLSARVLLLTVCKGACALPGAEIVETGLNVYRCGGVDLLVSEVLWGYWQG